jgi:signal transduction histidine kinase
VVSTGKRLGHKQGSLLPLWGDFFTVHYRHQAVLNRLTCVSSTDFPQKTWVRPAPEPRSYLHDAITGACLLVLSGITTVLYWRLDLYEDVAPWWLSAIALVWMCLPLAFRKKWPITVMFVVLGAFIVVVELHVPEALISNIAMFLAIYSVGAWSKNRKAATIARVVFGIIFFGWLFISVVFKSADPASTMPGAALTSKFTVFAALAVLQVIINGLYLGAAIFFGEQSWRSARLRATLSRKNIELQRERETVAEQAVSLDRIRIARELHDVVAHHISAVNIHAGAARMSVAHSPDQALEALETVEQSAEDAISDLRLLVYSLREPDTGRDTSFAGVSQISELIEYSQQAGTPVEYQVSGTPRELANTVENTLYRTVQEALTNVRKHAGSGARAEVRLRFLEGRVEVEILDNGSSSPRHSRRHGGAQHGGLGLPGMRERVAAVGGTLVAQPRQTRGFLVRATIPNRNLNMQASANSPSDLPATGEEPMS